LYFYNVPPPIKKKPVELLKRATAAKDPVAKAKDSLPKKAPVRRKKAPAKKRKPFPMALKIFIAGLLLILFSPLYYGYVLKLFSSTSRWIMDIGEDPNYRTYKSYAIRIPKKYSIHGIDVSSYQGKIDWKKVKSMKEDSVHITFAFIKATEGISSVDAYFQRNWREAPKAGIICGAYHYFIPRKSGLWQARFFLQTVKFEEGDLPPVVDVEDLSGQSPEKMRKELKDFIHHVEKKTGVKPIIYSGLVFYRDYLKGYFDGYPLWIAHYYQQELKAGATTKWHFWQHSDKARINGISHIVDFNAFKGDSLSFQHLLIR